MFFTEAKTDAEEEEGTISRPGSPKEGEEEVKGEATDEAGTGVAPVVREKSAASVRIGTFEFFVLFFVGVSQIFMILIKYSCMFI